MARIPPLRPEDLTPEQTEVRDRIRQSMANRMGSAALDRQGALVMAAAAQGIAISPMPGMVPQPVVPRMD